MLITFSIMLQCVQYCSQRLTAECSIRVFQYTLPHALESIGLLKVYTPPSMVALVYTSPSMLALCRHKIGLCDYEHTAIVCDCQYTIMIV